jgi:TolA-binding protein
MFNRLEKIANEKWNILRANVGQMRCYLILGQYEDAITAAGKIKKSSVANEAMIREANFTEGKSYYQLNNYEKAMSGLKSVAADVKYEQGAESKYLLAEIYYRQKNLQKSEDEIIDFISKNTPYQYWLGKSFLLLADIYLGKNDQFQAKHTLKSLYENYNDDDDGIKAEAAKKLLVIENEEKSEQQKAIDSSFQIKIK